MILNINNVPPAGPNVSGETTNAVKKTVELHTIFSNEVLANTKLAFEKMCGLKIIDSKDYERVNTIIDKIADEKKNTLPHNAPPLENHA